MVTRATQPGDRSTVEGTLRAVNDLTLDSLKIQFPSGEETLHLRLQVFYSIVEQRGR